MILMCPQNVLLMLMKDVTASPGIRNRDVRVAEIVARELEKTKADKWASVQARDRWSPKEKIQVCPGHF
jgi:hypothetical protein